MKFHGVDMRGNFILPRGTNNPAAGTEARLFYNSSEKYPYFDNGTSWVKLAKYSDLTDHISDAIGAHAATAISYDNSISGLTAINVKTALDELSNADGISYDNSISGLTATNIQDALDEIDNTLDSLSLTATNITFSPTGTISSTNVQSAIAELDNDIQGMTTTGGMRALLKGLVTTQNDVFRILTGTSGTLTEAVIRVGTAPSSDCTVTITKNDTGTPLCTLTITSGNYYASTTTLDSSAKTYTKTDFYNLNVTAAGSAQDLMLALV